MDDEILDLQALNHTVICEKYDSEGRVLIRITKFTVPSNGISMIIANHNDDVIQLTDIQVEFMLDMLTRF